MLKLNEINKKNKKLSKEVISIKKIRFDNITITKSKLTIAGVKIRFLNPTEEIVDTIKLDSLTNRHERQFNDLSVIIHLEYNQKVIIFSADATLNNFSSLCNTVNPSKLLSSNILKVAHHGSKENNSNEILKKIVSANNNVSIISTDGGIRYNSLPSDDVINFLKEDLKARVLCTSEIPSTVDSQPLIDLGQSQDLNDGIRNFTKPHKSKSNNGYIKLSIDENGQIATEIIP